MSLSDKRLAHTKYNDGEEYIDHFLFKENDVKEFIKQLKEIKKIWSDLSLECPMCLKEKKLWVHGKSNCYDCEIDKLAGDKLTTPKATYPNSEVLNG